LISFRRLANGFFIVFFVAVLLAAFNYKSILTAAGNYLVETARPEKADAVLVLAGDYRGSRIRRATELVKAGYAPVALVSGPTEMYGVNEANLAIQYMIARGAPSDYFEPIHIRALSTFEEARAFDSELQKRNIHTLLLVTSNYHTRRAAETFRRAVGKNIRIVPIAAEDSYFRPDAWWHNREGQKTVFYEYSKTIAAWLGM
jgi:uncharacterized SAM-binding protein YcdF (DUF218 family)